MSTFIDIHTHQAITAKGVLAIYNEMLPIINPSFSTIRSVGWHPWHIGKIDINEAKLQFDEAVTKPGVVAIGECGLDRIIDIPLQKQLQFLQFQLEYAENKHLPVIVHCVKAYSDLLEILHQIKYKGILILHGYNGNIQQTNALMKFDTYFSMGVKIMNKQPQLPKALEFIPQNKLFFETDDSPLTIETIYTMAAKQLNINIEILKDQMFANFKMAFKNLNADCFIETESTLPQS